MLDESLTLRLRMEKCTMQLRCNIQTCRRSLSGIFWVTRCSHTFCEEHANSLTQNNVPCPACPACRTILGKRFDVIRQNSNPTEEFRAMRLVGLRPEIVFDMAMRAVSFWNYQVEHELKFQSASSKYHKEVSEKNENKNTSLMRQLAVAKKSSDIKEKHIEELESTIKRMTEKMDSTDQQFKKLQHLFNSVTPLSQPWLLGTESYADPEFISGDSHMQSYLNSQGEMKSGTKNSDFVFEPRFAPKKKEV